jgi:hypothetical protein
VEMPDQDSNDLDKCMRIIADDSGVAGHSQVLIMADPLKNSHAYFCLVRSVEMDGPCG